MREIVLDTETTGLDAKGGDRLIELGCIELVNRFPSGRTLHHYCEPEGRAIHPDAEAVHGISADFLKDKPPFRAVVDEVLAFIDGAPLVIHNAAFDIAFLNLELERAGRPPIPAERVIDTLALARRKHPAGPNSLDALCKRYGIDSSKRTKHGALTDAALLAEVYIELLGERQAALELTGLSPLAEDRELVRPGAVVRSRPLPPRLTAEQEAAHRAFVAELGSRAIWLRYEEGAGAGDAAA
ncbi:MAG TPA: DNA polymerase III subunit epsilon [Hyphomicrobiaceae bacterium]|nr:DNA polymerase III subunit epsilon [Hyphomicrobiaceae bacterium]